MVIEYCRTTVSTCFLFFFLHLYLGGEQHLKKTEATDRIVMNGNKYKKVSQCIYYLKVVLLTEYWFEFPLCVQLWL